MIFLYSQADALRMDRRAKISLYLSGALILSALIICILLCARVNTANAEKMLYTVIGLFTLAGWAAILLFRLIYLPGAAAFRHMKSILDGEEAEMEGILTLTAASFKIPKSILVRKIILAGEDETYTLNLDSRFVKRLPPDGAHVRVRVVRKFITAFEVLS